MISIVSLALVFQIIYCVYTRCIFQLHICNCLIFSLSGKSYISKQALNRHMAALHSDWYCQECHTAFQTLIEYNVCTIFIFFVRFCLSNLNRIQRTYRLYTLFRFLLLRDCRKERRTRMIKHKKVP